MDGTTSRGPHHHQSQPPTVCTRDHRRHRKPLSNRSLVVADQINLITAFISYCSTINLFGTNKRIYICQTSFRRSIMSVFTLLVTLGLASLTNAFAPSQTSNKMVSSYSNVNRKKMTPSYMPQIRSQQNKQITTLHNGIIMDVDDNFFTATFFSIGLLYSLGKAYNRYLLEEVAFEQRKMEARERRLEDDPTLSELDLRRDESESWTSIYGKRSRRREENSSVREVEGGRESKYGSRVAVLDDEFDDDDDFDGMTDEEIADFEARYGVEYDPYYDEPYDESELPEGKYKEDRSYGDRRYANGEVFYKDESTGMFYRQGSKPRQKKFWDLNSS